MQPNGEVIIVSELAPGLLCFDNGPVSCLVFLSWQLGHLLSLLQFDWTSEQAFWCYETLLSLSGWSARSPQTRFTFRDFLKKRKISWGSSLNKYYWDNTVVSGAQHRDFLQGNNTLQPVRHRILNATMSITYDCVLYLPLLMMSILVTEWWEGGWGGEKN